MKTQLKFFFVCLISLFVFSCKSYKVHHITNNFDYNKIKNNGIIYYLPKTELLVTIEVTKTNYIKGIYSQYAEKLLNISNPSENSFTHYNISKIEITPKTLPDSNYMFYFEIPPRKFNKKHAIMLNFDDYGILSEINTLSNRRKSGNNINIDTNLLDNKDIKETSPLVLYNLYEKTDTIIEKILVDSTIIEKRIYKTKIVSKSEEQKAMEIASIIIDLQDARTKLLTGEAEVPYDPKTIRYMCEQLEFKEKQYLQLFTGQVIQSKQIYQFTVNPINIHKNIPLCSFNKTSGIKSIDNSDNIIITFEPLTKSNINPTLLKSKTSSKSFYLKVPNCIKTVINYNNDILYSQIINIPQFSDVTALPIAKITLKLNESAGSIQKIKVQ